MLTLRDAENKDLIVVQEDSMNRFFLAIAPDRVIISTLQLEGGRLVEGDLNTALVAVGAAMREGNPSRSRAIYIAGQIPTAFAVAIGLVYYRFYDVVVDGQKIEV